MGKITSILLVSSIALFFTACGGGPKIVIPSYTAPKEAAKLSKIETKDEFISDGAYLAVWLNPKVEGSSVNSRIADMLVSEIKAKLTETNFITLDPLGGASDVSLRMKILDYNYNETDGGKKAAFNVEVEFTLYRASEEFLTKKYKDRKNPRSKDVSKMPTENEIASKSVSKIVKYFISDISPLKTYQTREFKSLDSSLDGIVISYAKRKNYKGAIKKMNKFKGEKDMNYHYDLAILYEAEASKTENLVLLEKAGEHYDEALAKGGANDKLVLSASARFENFYELLKKTKKQDAANQALIQDRNSMKSDSMDEYE